VYEVASQAAPTRAEPGRPGAPVDPARLVLALRGASRTIAVAAIVSTLAAGLFARFAVERTYGAEATLTWEPPDGSTDATTESHTIDTIVASAELPTNLARVRQELALSSTLPEIAARLEVAHEEGSRLVFVRATAPSREEAEQLTTAACDALLEHRAELERARLSDGLDRTERALVAAERARDEARRTFDAFRAEHGIADVDAEMEHAISSAADLRTRALVARSDAEALTAQVGSLRAQERVSRTTAPLSETTHDPGAERLGETRTELTSTRAHLTDEHPEVRALAAQARALQSRPPAPVVGSRTYGQNPEWVALREGVATVTAEREASRLREEALSGLASSERARVDRLAAVEGRVAELRAVVEVAHARVVELQTEAESLRTRLEVVAADLRLVAPAMSPEQPLRSPRRLVTGAGLVAGLVLAVLGTLLRATWGLRVHTASEASFWSGAPTIASTRWPREGHRVHELVADLVALLPARPLALVVVSENEPGHASALARALRRARAPQVSRGETIRTLRSAEASSAARRAARAADLVIVILASGRTGGLRLLDLHARLGREDRVALVVSELGAPLARVADRAGRLELAGLAAPAAHDAPSSGAHRERRASHDPPTDLEPPTDEETP
jgi:uncharacterized protein involved in exopolysaccharide biosynthesis